MRYWEGVTGGMLLVERWMRGRYVFDLQVGAVGDGQ